MGAEGVVRGQLLGDLARQLRLDAAMHVDAGELAQLGGRLLLELLLSFDRSAFSASACEWTETYSPAAIDIAPPTRPATPASSEAAVRRAGGRDADQQARGRDDAVVRAEDRGAKPADAVGPVAFEVATGARHGRYSPSTPPADSRTPC